MYFLRNVIIFWLKPGIFSQIRLWKKFPIFLGQNFFWNFFEKIFFAINQPKKEFKAKKIFSKNFKKNFWYKNFFWKKLICEKTPSLSKKWWYVMVCVHFQSSISYESVQLSPLVLIGTSSLRSPSPRDSSMNQTHPSPFGQHVFST